MSKIVNTNNVIFVNKDLNVIIRFDLNRNNRVSFVLIQKNLESLSQVPSGVRINIPGKRQ